MHRARALAELDALEAHLDRAHDLLGADTELQPAAIISPSASEQQLRAEADSLRQVSTLTQSAAACDLYLFSDRLLVVAGA